MPETVTETPKPSAVERAMAALDAKEAPPAAAEAPPEPAKTEATPEVAKEEAKVEDKPAAKGPSAAERFAAMARKERQIVERDRALKDREAELSKREAAIKVAEDRRAEYRSDPLKALSDQGLSYEDLTKLMLNKTDPTAQQAVALRQLQEQVEQAKREAQAAREAIAKAQQEREQAEREQTRGSFQGEIKAHIAANLDKYELVSLYGQERLVMAVIEAEYEKTGEMPTVDAAAEKVEKYLETEADKAFKAKKFAARFAPPAPPKTPTPTLGNGTTPAPAPMNGKRSESDRLAAAIAALKD